MVHTFIYYKKSALRDTNKYVEIYLEVNEKLISFKNWFSNNELLIFYDEIHLFKV